MSIERIIKKLDSFKPQEHDSLEDYEVLYDILEDFDQDPLKARALESLFRILERFPGADLGHPGPLVHAIESIPEFVPRLRQSVKLVPTYLNVWMVNRVLNSEITKSDRADLLLLLGEVAKRTDVDPDAKQSAIEFLEYQAGAA